MNIKKHLTGCDRKNWDGYGACAISEKTIEEAEFFLDLLLALGVAMPDIIPEPTGAIAFEWPDIGILSIDEKGFVFIS